MEESSDMKKRSTNRVSPLDYAKRRVGLSERRRFPPTCGVCLRSEQVVMGWKVRYVGCSQDGVQRRLIASLHAPVECD